MNASILKITFKICFALVVLYFLIKSVRKGIEKSKELSVCIGVVGMYLLIPASATYHLLFLIPALVLLLYWMKKNEMSNMKINSILFLVVVSCNLLPHHIPTLLNLETINTIIHFPRLYALILLFTVLLVMQNQFLKNIKVPISQES
jgi:hypothetical protein